MKNAPIGLAGLLAALLMPASAAADSRLINGKPVDPGTYKEVVRIRSDGAGCTATVVGPRAIVTAAHCAKTGGTATFTVDGKNYSATMTRSPVYPGRDHDVSLGLVDREVTGVQPASIGGTATQSLGLILLGYGCVKPGGGGGNDGVLRIGESTIIEFSGFDMVSRKAGGAALCFGDSGGPAFVVANGKKYLLGINSKGNIQDTNYNARLDHQESKKFLQNYTQQNSIKICGVNLDCNGDPQDPPPTCNLSASPSTLQVGQSTTLSVATSGKVTSAKINGHSVTFPTGSTVEIGNSVGTFTAQAEVIGPGGTGSCSASYTVTNNPNPLPPTCTLSANPQSIKLGEQLTLELAVQGNAATASIEGTPVPIANGKKMVKPAAAGNFTASANATGPGGTGTCQASYEVSDDDPIDPSAPNFSIIPSYCGTNTLAATKVTKVCLAVVKKDAAMTGLRVTQTVMITYEDGTKEVLPIIAVAARPKNPGEATKEDLTLFTNNLIPASNYLVMDTRKAILTKSFNGEREVPSAIEGRTATGKYFMVEQLKLPGIVHIPTIARGW